MARASARFALACLLASSCASATESTPAQQSEPRPTPVEAAEPAKVEPSEPALPEPATTEAPEPASATASGTSEDRLDIFMRCHPHRVALVGFAPGEVTIAETNPAYAELEAMVERWAALPQNERPSVLRFNGARSVDETPIMAYERAHAVAALLAEFGLTGVEILVDARPPASERASAKDRQVVVWAHSRVDCLL